MSIQAKLAELSKSIPPACTLIAVSKMQPVETVREAYDAGHRHFGENKVQELVPKYEALPRDISWHLIGHLQRNKVKYIAPFVSMIHSVDSPALLEEINKQALKVQRTIPCLLQIHIAEEETKFGFSAEEVLDFLRGYGSRGLNNVVVQGLMGMATFTDNKEQVRREFKNLKNLFEKIKNIPLPPEVRMQELSMGMSGDYETAIEEGSTMIRVGTAIFRQRS
jgi:pyridoxal phosphate enzyme (YggS family)